MVWCMKFQAISEIIKTMDSSSPACKCGDKTPCPCNRQELRQLLKEQLEKANGDTTHWAYTEGDFEKIPCAHHGNKILHHHKDCGRVIGEHDASPQARSADDSSPARADSQLTVNQLRWADPVHQLQVRYHDVISVFGKQGEKSDTVRKTIKDKIHRFDCVVCNKPANCAHLIPRKADADRLNVQYDEESNFLPLCGDKGHPSCHKDFDEGRLCFSKCPEGVGEWYLHHDHKEPRIVVFPQQCQPHRKIMHGHAAWCLVTGQVKQLRLPETEVSHERTDMTCTTSSDEKDVSSTELKTRTVDEVVSPTSEKRQEPLRFGTDSVVPKKLSASVTPRATQVRQLDTVRRECAFCGVKFTNARACANHEKETHVQTTPPPTNRKR